MTQILEIDVPALEQPPAVGGSCCFVLLDDVVRAELAGWYGVEDVAVEGRRVRLRLADRHPPAADLVDAVRSLGADDVRVVTATDDDERV